MSTLLYESECRSKFPKIWNHPNRGHIEKMVDEGVPAIEIANWTRELSIEKGIKPGNTSNISVSYQVLLAYIKLRNQFSPKVDAPLPSKASEEVQRLERTAEDRKREAIDLLDRVITRCLEQLESGERVTLQNALQAIQLREQINTGNRIEVSLSIEVKHVMSQIIHVVNQVVSPEQRTQIAGLIGSLPALKAIEVAPDSLDEQSTKKE